MSPTPGPVPVLIVDDHPMVGSALARHLQAEGLAARFQPVSSTVAVLTAARLVRSGVVLLDLDLGRDRDGRRIDVPALIPRFTAAGWRILVLADGDSSQADIARIGAALAAGGLDWVPKAAPFATLLTALRAAIAGHSLTTPARRAQLIELHHLREQQQRQRAAPLATLTAREREILASLAIGQRAQAIAAHDVVTVVTVRTQIRGVLTKLGVNSQIEAVAVYQRARDPDHDGGPDHAPSHADPPGPTVEPGRPQARLRRPHPIPDRSLPAAADATPAPPRPPSDQR